MNEILFISGNSGKIQTFQQVFNKTKINIKIKNEKVEEIQSDDIKEIAINKAKKLYLKYKCPIIVNDSELKISALNDFPGPYTKFVLKTIGCQGIIELLKNNLNRECLFHQIYIFVDDAGKYTIFEDNVYGKISKVYNLVNNVNSWGDFWNIFIPKNSKKCRAELSSEVYYNAIRPKAADRNALEDLKQFLMFKYL